MLGVSIAAWRCACWISFTWKNNYSSVHCHIGFKNIGCDFSILSLLYYMKHALNHRNVCTFLIVIMDNRWSFSKWCMRSYFGSSFYNSSFGYLSVETCVYTCTRLKHFGMWNIKIVAIFDLNESGQKSVAKDLSLRRITVCIFCAEKN